MVTFDINNKIQKSNFARGAKQKVFNLIAQVTDQKPLPAAAVVRPVACTSTSTSTGSAHPETQHHDNTTILSMS